MEKPPSGYSVIHCEPEQLRKLFALHDEYTKQVDCIVSTIVENFEHHDCFFTWLLFTGNEEYQYVLSDLEDQNLFVGDRRTSCLYDDEGHEVIVDI